MSDSFKQRVRVEARLFPKLYADFLEDYKSKSEEGVVQSVWLHLFGVPFNGFVLDEKPSDDARRSLKAPHKHDAVARVIHELGINELRLGALEIKDTRVLAALESGLLTEDDLVPPSGNQPWEFERLVTRQKPDHSDPIFWRTLLEIFCRAFISSQGPGPWPLTKTIELAFDLDEIRRTLPNARWNADAARKALRKKPYITKYQGSNSKGGAVGEDRIRPITKLIGPMNDEALARLEAIFPEAFYKVAEAKSHNQFLQKKTNPTILDQAEDLGDALDASTRRKSDST
jgi:hypothetical protein